jgi:UrcA family protein
MKKWIVIIMGCAVTGSAAAQDRVVIDYSKTDLTTPVGASALYRRIVNVADAVCRPDPALGLHGQFVARECVRKAVTRAVEDVHSPLLTARHGGETADTLYSSRATMK